MNETNAVAKGLDILRASDGAGLLILGSAGPSRSGLAAGILGALEGDGFIAVTVQGRVGPDDILSAVADRLAALAESENGDERHPCRQLAAILLQKAHPWPHRFELLSQTFFAAVPLVMFLDHFEDNQADGGLDSETAAQLARWLRTPRRSRLLFCAEHPFALPDDADTDIALLPVPG